MTKLSGALPWDLSGTNLDKKMLPFLHTIFYFILFFFFWGGGMQVHDLQQSQSKTEFFFFLIRNFNYYLEGGSLYEKREMKENKSVQDSSKILPEK